VLHHISVGLVSASRNRICPLFLAHLDMQVTIINKILLLIVLDSVVLTWIKHCQIKHKTLVSSLLLISFPQLL